MTTLAKQSNKRVTDLLITTYVTQHAIRDPHEAPTATREPWKTIKSFKVRLN